MNLYISAENGEALEALCELWGMSPGQVIGRLLKEAKPEGGE